VCYREVEALRDLLQRQPDVSQANDVSNVGLYKLGPSIRLSRQGSESILAIAVVVVICERAKE
jgi:hypothetical protein